MRPLLTTGAALTAWAASYVSCGLDDSLERELVRTFRHADPVIGSELFDRPFTVEAAQARVLFATEHHVSFIIDRDVIDVSHAGLNGLFGILGVDGFGDRGVLKA